MEPAIGGLDPHGAYTILKRWYRHTPIRTPNPSRIDMEKVRGDFQTLYQREEPQPPGLPLATHVNPDEVNDKVSLEVEVEAEVGRLRPHRAGGHTPLCAEPFKQ